MAVRECGTAAWRWLATASLLVVAGCGAAAPPPSVLLVVLDTVRADRISCYGYERRTTPNLDVLCARGVRFANASSSSSWTLPAHASLFTGLHPIQHGATQEQPRLGLEATTLAERFAAAGYATFAASANPVVSTRNGLARGFGDFAETWRGGPAGGEHPNLGALRRFLAGVPTGRPFFAFLNFTEAHAPYAPPPAARARFVDPSADPALARRAATRTTADLYTSPEPPSAAERELISDLYDAELAGLDDTLGALFELIAETGHEDRTLVVVTSDHGENLGEQGHFRHVFSLTGAAVRIPLILAFPDGRLAGDVREDSVGLVDLHATLLELAGLGAGASEGRDLFAEPPPAPVLAEYYYPLQVLGSFPEPALQHEDQLAPYRRRLRSIEMDGLRLVWSSDGRHELYDVGRDPEQARDVYGDPAYAEAAAQLLARIEVFRDSRGRSLVPLPGIDDQRSFDGVDDETAERLRELGYVR